MTVEMATALRNALNNFVCRAVEPSAVTLAELALCTDSSFTEVTDGAYDRADLTADLAASSAGEITDSFNFNVGSQTATHWQILHDNVWKVRGPLTDSKTGAFTLAFSDIMRGTTL